jgi:prevent-host-death family protein
MTRPKQQKTESMSVSEARKHFSDVVTRSMRGEGRVIVEKSGTPVGAIVSIDDLHRLEELDREWAEIEEVFKRTQAGFRGTSPEVLEQEIEKAIAEVEADYKTAQHNDRHSA